MKTVTINISKGRRAWRTLRLALPSGWEELSRQEAFRLAPSLMIGEPFSRATVYALLRYEHKAVFRRPGNKILNKLSAEVLGVLFDELDWLVTENPVFPIASGASGMLLPDRRLANAVAIEYGYADMAYNVASFYQKQGDHKNEHLWLSRVIAYLLRPRDPRINRHDPNTWAGDQRERFNEDLCERRVQKIEKFDPRWRFLILRYFEACKRYIHDKYKGVLWFDTHTAEGEPIVGVDTRPQPKMILDSISKLAGGKFGTYQETAYTNLYLFLDELADQRRRSINANK